MFVGGVTYMVTTVAKGGRKPKTGFWVVEGVRQKRRL
jgi:hypothetical protein